MGRRWGTFEVEKRFLEFATHDATVSCLGREDILLAGRVRLEPYAVFADDGEYGQEIGEAEEFANSLAHVEELHLASF